MRQSMKRLWIRSTPALLMLATALAVFGHSGDAQAEERPLVAPTVGYEDEVVPPSAEDVKQMIRDLASVRDYERLGWVLGAIEQQVPPIRAELLQTLDDHVQQLLQHEVELRTASAVAGLQAISGTEQAADTGSAPAEPASVARAEWASKTPESTRAPWVEPQDYGDVKGQIEDLEFSADSRERAQQMRELARAISGVEEYERRKELDELLLERKQETIAAQSAAKHAELQDRMGDDDSFKEVIRELGL